MFCFTFGKYVNFCLFFCYHFEILFYLLFKFSYKYIKIISYMQSKQPKSNLNNSNSTQALKKG